MNKPPKIDRKTLKQPDTFVAKGTQTLSWIGGHRVTIVAVLGFGLIAAFVSYGLDWWSSRRLDEAWSSYNLAIKLPEPRKWEDLKTVYSRWKPSRAALFASVALADHYYDEAKKEALKEDEGAPAANAAQASEWYTLALGTDGLLPAEKQLLHINKGNAAEIEKKYDVALEEYQKAVDAAVEYKALALLGLARIHELKHETQKAVETYERISVDFSNTEYAKLAKNYLRRLKSPLFQMPQTAAPTPKAPG